MDHRLPLNRILPLMLLIGTVYTTRATLVQNLYKKMEEPGQNITGTILEQTSTTSQIQCSVRCSKEVECKAYQYKGTMVGNCLLIDTSISDGAMTFLVNQDTAIYKKECIHKYAGAWTPPCPWTGPYPVKYWSFDTLDGLVLMEGPVKSNFSALTPGKVNNAVTTGHLQNQWIDLGIHTEACMTQPETCGAAGGAVSLWMKLVECPDWAGVISSWTRTTGFVIYCASGGNFTRFVVYLPQGRFATAIEEEPTNWTHVILNYLGPEEGMGTRTYLDGRYSAGDSSIGGEANPIGDSRLVIGRRYTTRDNDYASAEVDEVLLFNAALTEQEIQILSAHE